MQTRLLGGEGGHRSVFGNSAPPVRRYGLMTVAVVTCLLMVLTGVAGLLIGVVAAAVLWVATIKTDAGTLLGAHRRKRAWREKQRTGTTVFRPVRDRPEYLLEPVTGTAARRQQAREYAAFRDCPDGAEGFRWLQDEPGLPGIAWHMPTGEDPWLSAVWSVSGQVRGIRSDGYLEEGMVAFSRLLGRYGSPAALPSRIQVLTRALPLDPVPHQAWVWQQMAPDVPKELVRSYEDLVATVTAEGLTQRHFVVVRWPIGPRFRAAAASRGPGSDGWRALMAAEVAAVGDHLAAAMLGEVQSLTAKGVAGALRHLQHPSWPVDQVGDVDVDCPWLPSDEDWSAVTVTAANPRGVLESWKHRTAVVPIDAVETAARTPLWFSPLLTTLRSPIVRTVSVQLETHSAAEARKKARDDLTIDLSEIEEQQAKGVLTDEELMVAHGAAYQRYQDLRPGTGYVGVGWAMHITISARTTVELDDATDRINSAAEDAGIAMLQWLDGAHAAGQACTWPLARGMKPVDRPGSGLMADRLALRISKEDTHEGAVTAA